MPPSMNSRLANPPSCEKELPETAFDGHLPTMLSTAVPQAMLASYMQPDEQEQQAHHELLALRDQILTAHASVLRDAPGPLAFTVQNALPHALTHSGIDVGYGAGNYDKLVAAMPVMPVTYLRVVPRKK